VSESFEAYNRAVSLDPKCDKGYQGLANICFYKLNQNARGREYALKALGCDSTNIYALIIVAFTEETF
jgi:cytochrome c-type biogenesis protein CcmH/NrfG